MSPATLFRVCSMLVLPGWLLLVFAPRWRWSARIIACVVIPLLLALLYLYLVVAHFGESGGGFGSLAEVSKLFENPYALLAGWIHYLAFDLFIGSWEVRDAQREGVHHLLVVPCLALTFLFGPIGLLLYFALRLIVKRRLVVNEENA
ncbi:MAG TPA: ABA4-like family protein [Pyrinomonadaceae bacterium]